MIDRLLFGVAAAAASGCSGGSGGPAPTPVAPPNPIAASTPTVQKPSEPWVAVGTPPPAADPAPTFPDGSPVRPCSQPPPGMACIPGGPFLRGTDDGPENTRPQERVHVRTFFLDVHEVTYAQYKACERAGQCPRSGPRYRGYDYPDMPVTGVSWYDAAAYCRAHGKRLPSEAEWEKAARGDQGQLNPWGNERATCDRAILMDASGRGCGLRKEHGKPETGRPWDVGSRPVGRYGLFDMVGNSWEWVADWYAPSYDACGDACRGVDPRGPCGGAEPCPGHRRKIVRGGSWYWTADYNTGVYRRAHVPNNEPFHHFGFRCAGDLPEGAPAER